MTDRERLNRNQRNYYHRNRERLRGNSTKEHRIKKLKAIEYLGGKCKDCNGVFHQSVYDFHHLNPKEKDSILAHLFWKSWDKILIELNKCILLCANCHRLRHWSIVNET